MRVNLLVLVAVALAACGRTPEPTLQPSPSAGQLITAVDIEESGAQTAWDALRLTVRHITFRENNRLQPVKMTRRGTSSILLNDEPRIILDNIRLADYSVLDQMAAANISTIQVLTGLDATTYYGTSAMSGVIIIRTKTGAS